MTGFSGQQSTLLRGMQSRVHKQGQALFRASRTSLHCSRTAAEHMHVLTSHHTQNVLDTDSFNSTKIAPSLPSSLSPLVATVVSDCRLVPPIDNDATMPSLWVVVSYHCNYCMKLYSDQCWFERLPRLLSNVPRRMGHPEARVLALDGRATPQRQDCY